MTPHVNRVCLRGEIARAPSVGRDGAGQLQLRVLLTTREPGWGTEHHPIVYQGASVMKLALALRQGEPLAVEGRIVTYRWRDPEGEERAQPIVIAHRIVPAASEEKRLAS